MTRAAVPESRTAKTQARRRGILAIVAHAGGLVAAEWRRASWPARASAICLLLFYLMAAASPVIAPYDPARQYRRLPDCPPMRLHLVLPGRGAPGLFCFHPMRMADPLARRMVEERTRWERLRFFYRGHLFSTASGAAPFFVLGSDALGRDLFSRIVYGARVSMCVGLIAIAVSFSLGITAGSIAGYAGGVTDNLIMRWAEVEMSLPSFYFLLALAALMPAGASTVRTFVTIVLIMSFISWAGLARVIRGMAAAARGLAYVEAARALGASAPRVVARHVVPSLLAYALVAATLAVPGFILGESALSLLGLGVQEPAASWGNLLAQAQDVQNLGRYPWILAPGVFIFLAIMSFNFLGDYLRDRLDPAQHGR